MRSRVRFIPVLLLVLSAAASAQEAPDVRDLVPGDTAFACDLYGALRATETGNFFYSPYSISSALSMAWAGARGETAVDMAKTLRFDRLGEGVHAKRRALDRELARREGARPERGGDPFRLRIANALWGQIGHDFRPEFLELVATHYGAGLRNLDFANDPDGSRRAINAEIEAATEKRIQELLAPPNVTKDTRLVLTNAIWFKASWSEPFPDHASSPRPFHLADGSKVDVPTMHRSESFPYLEGDGFQAVEIPYAGEEVAMLVLLPAEGRFAGFEEALSGERLEAIAAGLQGARVDLGLPRFEVRSSFSLVDALRRLGMARAFDDADFSGMTEKPELAISDVIHQTFVKVDEKGTEAAAATAIVMGPTGMPPRSIAMAVDRPFLFLVRDRKTGAVLFLGRVLDPR